MERKISAAALLMLVFALLMFGCGSSGGGDTSAGGVTGNNGGVVIGKASDNPGYVMFNFNLGTTSESSAVMKSASSSLPLAQWARVVIRHSTTVSDPEIGDYTITDYKQIQDFDLSLSTTATMTVNPGTDYSVDVVSYLKNPDHNTLLKHGSTTVSVVSGQTTQASITAAPFDVGLTPPNPIAAGSAYVVSWNTGTSLRSEKNLRFSAAPVTDLFAYNPANSSFQLQAPALNVTDPPSALYFQGLFFLSDDLLNPLTESWQYWRYYEPNPAEFSDSQLTSTVTPPGAITIDVTL